MNDRIWLLYNVLAVLFNKNVYNSFCNSYDYALMNQGETLKMDLS